MGKIKALSLLAIFAAALTSSAQNTPGEKVIIHRDSIALNGIFFRAPAEENAPTLILLHGFPGNESDVFGIGAFLSLSGINCLTFNYSGTYGSQGQYSMIESQADIGAAYRFLTDPDIINLYNIDTSRIMLGGYSFGGGMALTFAATHPQIKAVFSIAGTDHGQFFRDYFSNKQFAKMIDNMFDKLQAPDGPVRFVPGTMPNELTPELVNELDSCIDLRKAATLLADKKILLIAGWNDPMVTVENHMLPLYRTFQKAGANNTRIIGFQDGHGFGNVRDDLRLAILNWIMAGQ